MSRLFDISPPVSPASPVWAGDTRFALERRWDRERGDAVNVCRLTLSPHTGAHADAPDHVGATWGRATGTGQPLGSDADGLPLEAYWGPCRVLDWTLYEDVDAPALAMHDWDGVERVLFHTLEAPPTEFGEDFPHFTKAGAEYLAALGVARGGTLRLVGLDTFSVDAAGSKELPAHHAFFGAGIGVLEGLDLSAVPAGEYELVALPIRLVGADAAPVRAVLRERRAES